MIREHQSLGAKDQTSQVKTLGGALGQGALSHGVAGASARQQSAEINGATKSKKPFTVAGTGERVILEPKTPNGKTLYFFYGYTGTKKDIAMRAKEMPDLEDDVYGAAASGFRVVYDKAGTRDDFFKALYDGNSYGIYWSGHGGGGSIQTSDGMMVGPDDVNTTKVSKKLQYLILAACQTGTSEKKWKKALGGSAQFQGWVKNTNTSETTDFTSEAAVDDSWVSHNGTNPNKELDDYIDDARQAK